MRIAKVNNKFYLVYGREGIKNKPINVIMRLHYRFNLSIKGTVPEELIGKRVVINIEPLPEKEQPKYRKKENWITLVR